MTAPTRAALRCRIETLTKACEPCPVVGTAKVFAGLLRRAGRVLAEDGCPGCPWDDPVLCPRQTAEGLCDRLVAEIPEDWEREVDTKGDE